MSSELNHETTVRSGVNFESLWRRELSPLEAPNRRGRGTSSVAMVEGGDWPELGMNGRLYVKRQQAFFCRPLWNSFRRTPTLRRELKFIEMARALGVAVPDVVRYVEGSNDRALLVLKGIAEVDDLERYIAGTSDDERETVLRNLGKMLTKLHSARILHGAIYPKHVLVEAAAPHCIWLIDFEKARHVASRSSAAVRDIARLRRHSPFMTNADLEALVSAYDRRAFPRLLEKLKTEVR